MIYPVQILWPTAGITVAATSYSETTVEGASGLSTFNVASIVKPVLTFYNANCADCQIRLTVTVAVSGQFSDTYTLVNDAALASGSTYTHSFDSPLIKTNSKLTHTVRLINNDGSARRIYCLIGGYTDIKATLSNYVGYV